jgi:Zn-dependent protease with chaperone function
VHLVVLILIAVVLLEDRMPFTDLAVSQAGVGAHFSGWVPLVTVLIVPLVALGLQWLAVRSAERAMDQGDASAARAFARADSIMAAIPWIALLATAIATLALDWVPAVRRVVGDWPAVDELLAMLPAFAAMAASWRIHEPIERRVRDAALIRDLDAGVPISTWRSPTRFVLGRVRTNILLLLAPLLTVVALTELAEPLVRSAWPEFWTAGGRELVTLSVAAVVYLLSPLIARLVLQLESLPDGELRRDLQAVCDACGVRVRDILLWRTDQGMVNGAVMGLVAPLRYVMLTDGLVELLPRDELRAVMAHEIGHVRRHHLPWMLLMLVALLGLASFAVEWPAVTIDESIRHASWDLEEKLEAMVWLERGAAILAATIALLLFGWVSRRIERQADTFAVQYLSGTTDSPAITPDAVVAMSGALGSVARFAGVSRERISWRHGSIRWRQAYLERIVGAPANRLPIDRLVGRLKALALAIVLLFGIAFAMEVMNSPTATPDGESGADARYDAPSSVGDGKPGP